MEKQLFLINTYRAHENWYEPEKLGFRLFFLTTPCQTILRPEYYSLREVVLKKALFALYVFLIIPMWSKKSMPSTSFVHWIYFSHQIKLEIWYIRICGLPILSNIQMCVGVFLQGTISTLSMLRFLISMILRVYYTWTVNVRDWVSACL